MEMRFGVNPLAGRRRADPGRAEGRFSFRLPRVAGEREIVNPGSSTRGLSSLTRSLSLRVPAYFRRECSEEGREEGREGREGGSEGGREDRELLISQINNGVCAIPKFSEPKSGKRWTKSPVEPKLCEDLGAKMYGSILKHPGQEKKTAMIKHVEFLDNLIESDMYLREF